MAKSERRNANTNSKMSVEEAGRKGGEATSKSHDREFYEEIGRKGGENSGGQFESGSERTREAARKGGEQSGNNREER